MSKFTERLNRPKVPTTEVREWDIPGVGIVHRCIGCGALIKGSPIRCQRCVADLHAPERCKTCDQIAAQGLATRGALSDLLEACLKGGPLDEHLEAAARVLEGGESDQG